MSKQELHISDYARIRLRAARERSGKTPQEVAALAGMNLPSYFDCEHKDDLVEVISITELVALCKVLSIKVINLFSEEDISDLAIFSLDDLARTIRDHLNRGRIVVADLESKFGFEIAPALRNSDEIMNWSIEWLQLVCDEVGICWKAVLSKIDH